MAAPRMKKTITLEVTPDQIGSLRYALYNYQQACISETIFAKHIKNGLYRKYKQRDKNLSKLIDLLNEAVERFRSDVKEYLDQKVPR